MYLIAVQFLQRKSCESTQRQRKQKLLSRNEQQDRKPHCIYLQRSHIIECVVQFLADGLVFQLLSIQLICRAKGGERGRMKCRSNRRTGKFRGIATEQGEVEEKEEGKEMNVKCKNETLQILYTEMQDEHENEDFSKRKLECWKD